MWSQPVLHQPLSQRRSILLRARQCSRVVPDLGDIVETQELMCGHRPLLGELRLEAVRLEQTSDDLEAMRLDRLAIRSVCRTEVATRHRTGTAVQPSASTGT